MERRRLGGLEVSAVGLGCATMTPFYDEPDRDAAIDTLRHAREIGVDFLDSSDAYGQGRNEELIARAVKGHHDEYVIASKFGNLRAPDGSPTSDGRPEYVRARCQRSLKRLETDVIDLYYIHRVDPTVGGSVRLAFCCCQPLASITFCLQEGDFSLPDPVWSAILLRNCGNLANVGLGSSSSRRRRGSAAGGCWNEATAAGLVWAITGGRWGLPR